MEVPFGVNQLIRDFELITLKITTVLVAVTIIFSLLINWESTSIRERLMLIIPLIIMCGSLWYIICCEYTCKQRIEMLDSFANLSSLEYTRAAVAFDKVSFDRHLCAILTFHNPYLLYPEEAYKHVHLKNSRSLSCSDRE